MLKGRVLVIAGSDSGGGAGIQGDSKTITGLGGFATTAITALTAQNTQLVSAIHEVPVDFIKEQIRVIMTDIGADCIKLGMLHSIEVIEAVVEAIEAYATDIPIVSDTVMMAKGGAKLLANDAIKAFQTHILPISSLITPNIPEAEILSEQKISNSILAVEAGQKLLKYGSSAVLIKGGHLNHAKIIDQLLIDDKIHVFEGQRLKSRHTHGTGCAMASACATGIAQGLSIYDSVERAQKYVFKAILTAPGLGKGYGPLNHFHTNYNANTDAT